MYISTFISLYLTSTHIYNYTSTVYIYIYRYIPYIHTNTLSILSKDDAEGGWTSCWNNRPSSFRWGSGSRSSSRGRRMIGRVVAIPIEW